MDMTDTLVFIKKEIQNQENTVSHLLRWQLLDPFMAVVCIDRMVGVLKREGRPLRAAKSRTSILKGSRNMIMEAKAVVGIKNHILKPIHV